MDTQTQNSAFGPNLKAVRDERNLTQVELAEQLGVSPRTVQNWEAGLRPLARHRRLIVDWLETADAA